jgi:hypothetical protein
MALSLAALAAGMIALSGEAQAVCTPIVAGEVLSCANATSNPAAFTATDDFSVTLEGDPTAAVITRDDNASGLTINGGDYGGAIDVRSGSSITVGDGSGNRHGLVVTSSAATTEVYKIEINGMIASSDDNGDSLRLDGTDFSTFNIYVGANGVLGNSQTGGDDGLIVLGARNVSLENRGTIAGGSWPGAGWTDGGAEGVLITDVGTPGTRIEGTVVIDNYGTIRGNVHDGIYDKGQGIYASADGAITINNKKDGEISGGSQGVMVNGGSTVDIDNSGHIEGRQGAGVEVYAGTIVTVSNDARISGETDGVSLHDVEEALINNRDGRIRGREGYGVALSSVDGAARVVNWGGSISGRWDGIDAEGIEGEVVIGNGFGGSIIGWRADGIDLDDIDADVAIFNRFGGFVFGQDDGVTISDVWTGDVVVSNSFGGGIAGLRGSGLDIEEIDGSVRIDNAMFGRIAGGSDAIRIADVERRVSIDNRLGGQIESRRGDAVDLEDIDGRVSIDNRYGGRIVGDEKGIEADEIDGRVQIDNRFGGRIKGRDDDGIDLNEIDGDVIIANSYGGRIRGDDNAVSIDDVDGDVTIYNHRGSIHADDGDGIDVSDVDGRVSIQNGLGEIRGDEHAISIEAESAVINSAGLIRGEGSRRDPTISLRTEYGAIINNWRGGVIRGDDNDSDELIVAARGGAVEINNAGDLMGRIDLEDAGNSQEGNRVNNYSDESWTFTGRSEFGDGSNDVFDNTGTTHTTDPDDPSENDVTMFAGLESFINGDTSNDGTLTMQDGYTGDETQVTPTRDATLVFSGVAGHSFLDVDAFLGTAATSASDLLVVNGDVAGQTGVNLADLSSGFGAYNPAGTVVVDVNGDTDVGDFFLVGGPVDKGLFQYDLALNDENEWVLASTPGQRFFELPSLVSATQTMWQNAAGVWLDRTADLRSALSSSCTSSQAGSLKDAPAVCSSNVTPGAWAKVLGTTVSTSENHHASLFDNTYGFKVESHQRGYGIVAGFDFGRETQSAEGPGAWMFGVMAGYLQSSLDFDRSSTSADFDGALVGGYATYVNGGWFLDAKLVVNVGDMDYKAGAMNVAVKDSAHFNSIGGVVDTGYRFSSGATFIEPGATLSYVSTDLDRLSVFDSSVDFGNDDSFRGRLGVRIGTVANYEQYKLEPFVGLSAWYEFAGDNTADVGSGGYVITARNDMGGATAQISGGINLFSLSDDGFSAFLKGDVELGRNDLVGFGGHGGIRYNW